MTNDTELNQLNQYQIVSSCDCEKKTGHRMEEGKKWRQYLVIFEFIHFFVEYIVIFYRQRYFVSITFKISCLFHSSFERNFMELN